MITTQMILSFREAPNYNDPDAFVSDLLLSSVFTDAEDETAEVDLTEADALRRVWTAANGSFPEFLRELDYTQTQLSREFSIPLRTVQDWCGGRRTPPDYLRLLLLIAIESI